MATHEIYGKNILIISGDAHNTTSVQPDLSLQSLGIPAFFCTLRWSRRGTRLFLVTSHISSTILSGRHYLEMIRQHIGRSEKDSYPTVNPCPTRLHHSQFSNLSSDIPKYDRVGFAVRTQPLSNPLNRALQLNQVSFSTWPAFSVWDFLEYMGFPLFLNILQNAPLM